MSRFVLDAAFVPAARGRMHITFRRPLDTPGCTVLFIPPFAEEMNKSRRMLALLGQMLAEQGVASALPDLHGTGDSDGEFCDADWETWKLDLQCAATWCAQNLAPVRAQVAVRLGAELAADACEHGLLPGIERTVLWQPAFDRNRHLTQFLRLRVAAMLTQDQQETADDLKRRLRGGEQIEVAGYELGSALGQCFLDAGSRTTLPTGWRNITWMEIVREDGAPVSPPSRKLIDSARAAGAQVDAFTTTGEPFWTSTEVATVMPMVARSIEVLTA